MTQETAQGTAVALVGVIDALTVDESDALARCEQTVVDGLHQAKLVGEALREIRDRRLYRRDFKTFDAYLTARWGFTRQRATQFIAAAEVASNLSTIVTTEPLNEAQARVLASLPPEEQRTVYTEALKMAGTPKKLTAELLKRTQINLTMAKAAVTPATDSKSVNALLKMVSRLADLEQRIHKLEEARRKLKKDIGLQRSKAENGLDETARADLARRLDEATKRAA
jgi:hypothetical protein